LCGYALRFNQPSVPLANGLRLQFDSCAFDEFLNCSPLDRYAVLRHEGVTEMFASWKRGSLLLDSDSHGIFCVVLPRNDHFGRVVTALVDGGHSNFMSTGVAYDQRHVRRSRDVEIVRTAAIREVSATDDPAMPGTTLQLADEQAGLPRTVEQLLALECELRGGNLRHAKAGTLSEWKRQKADDRAALCRSLLRTEAVCIAN
jgi:phage head maturation protease